jgi:hypothetical protein
MLISEIKWKVLGMIQPTMEISTAELRFLSLELAYEAACKLSDKILMVESRKKLQDAMIVLKKGKF